MYIKITTARDNWEWARRLLVQEIDSTWKYIKHLTQTPELLEAIEKLIIKIELQQTIC